MRSAARPEFLRDVSQESPGRLETTRNNVGWFQLAYFGEFRFASTAVRFDKTFILVGADCDRHAIQIFSCSKPPNPPPRDPSPIS